MKNKKNAVICLAVGFSQINILKKIKSQGFNLIGIDKDENADGIKYLDFFINESTHDYKLIIKKLTEISPQYNFVGIVNRSSGPPVISSAFICNHFNIQSLPFESAKNIVNKDLLKIYCKNEKISSTKFNVLNNYDVEKISKINFPFIVKPALSIVGKSGITIVKNLSNLKKAFFLAKELSLNGNVIIEEYLNGPDLSFISFVIDSKLYKVCLLDEINKHMYYFIIFGWGYKTHEDSYDLKLEKKIFEITQKIVQKLKIVRTPLMSCFRLNSKGEPKIIEIHLDLGGDLLLDNLLPIAMDCDYITHAVNYSLGYKNYKFINKPKPVAIIYERGSGSTLINRKGFKIIKANSQKELNHKINEYKS